MIYVIVYLMILLVLFISYLINKKRERLGLNKALKFIDKKYELNMDRKRVLNLSKILVFVNSLIIGVPACIAVCKINYMVILGISLMWFIIVIPISYNIIGKILKKKWNE